MREASGAVLQVVKGAFSVVADRAKSDAAALALVGKLEASGGRVLAVAAGPHGQLALAGLIALAIRRATTRPRSSRN